MANNHRTDTESLSNWYVITGAPCSGKTAVIDQLARLGYHTVPEVARAYIDAQLAQGQTLATIKSDITAFERHILMEKVRIEKHLPKDAIHFLDRAVPDSIAYYQLEGLDPDEPIRFSERKNYRVVFLFEALKFEKDRVRSENQSLSARIDHLLAIAYTELGCEIVRVPVMSIARRVALVLSYCRK